MKKLLKIIKNILVTIIVLFAISMMIFTIISVTTLDKTDRNLFGYKAFIVLTDSMSKTDFSAGDLVIVKETDPKSLKIGDIISYRSTNIEHYYEVVTHKIKEKTSQLGRPGFITYGTTTGTIDEEVVAYENVLGKYQFSIPRIGSFFQFLKTTPGYIICILTPFLLLILIQAIHSINLFRRYKKETVEEMDAEKKKLETERLETEMIKRQLATSEEKTKEIEKEIAKLKNELKKKKSFTKKEEKVAEPKTATTPKSRTTKKQKTDTKTTKKPTTRGDTTKKKTSTKVSKTVKLSTVKKKTKETKTKTSAKRGGSKK